MQAKSRTGISRRDVLHAFEAAARTAGVEAAVDVLLDWAEAAQLQAILEQLADTAAAYQIGRQMDPPPLQAVRADRQPSA